ncbi:potassium channel family protein [Marinicrinis lubricantis]|uniref:Potassium channel family protein n=1 Tax=Marinicrinis lubricantis TaxID=2086470 RepID=A0ABW1IUT3_9BACL
MKYSQFAVIGLGRFGSSLAKELIAQGYEVMGIDKNEEIADDMSDELTFTAAADTTDEEVLKELGIRNSDCVIIAIGNDIQASIMTAILLKDFGVKKVVAKALSELHGRVLEKIGVDRVIYPERDMAIRLAHQLVQPNILDFIELSNKYTIAELSAPQKISGKTLGKLDTRAKYGCSVVALHKQEEILIAPSANDVVDKDDIMVLIGTKQQIERFEDAVTD